MTESGGPTTGGVETRLQVMREGVAAVLALAIVGSTLYWMGSSFQMTGDPTRMGDAKDLLALMSGLAGVVVGYYFGRVPSDARATEAHERMDAAMDDKQRMKTSMEVTEGTLQQIEAKLQTMARTEATFTMDDLADVQGLIHPRRDTA